MVTILQSEIIHDYTHYTYNHYFEITHADNCDSAKDVIH